jgi:RimJ/RimL family protein N-acetyltransferase
MKEAPLLKTERLVLTWPTTEQIDQYYQDIVGTNMFDSIIWDGPQSENDMHDYWKMTKQNNPLDLSIDLNFSLILKDTHQLIGGASLRPVNRDFHFINLGYALAPKFHGNGYATEAIKKLIEHAFSHRKAERIFATVFVDNIASKRVLEKNNFKYEGTLRHCVKKYNQWRDEWLFALIKPEWENLCKKPI